MADLPTECMAVADHMDSRLAAGADPETLKQALEEGVKLLSGETDAEFMARRGINNGAAYGCVGMVG